MKKYLISNEGKFYKANLHSHSTVSDGELSPEQMKALYLEHGYSIIAFTDHNHFVTHNDLTDEAFLALNGVENAADEQTEQRFGGRCCDICFIALSPKRKLHPMQNEENIIGNSEYAPYVPPYSADGVNEMIAKGVNNGFFATYNHPTWSMENFSVYMSYNGMNAMEIFNTSSAVDGYNEYNPDIYDDMLRGGKRIFCIATDDNHNRAPNTLHWDSFGGFTMIKSRSLKYEDVTSALKNGDFYASTGALIKELWLDTADNSVHIECEKAKKIVCTRGCRRLRAVYAEERNTEYIEGAFFSINKEDEYFRFTVTDENGNVAETNAYFIDELGIDLENNNAFVE